MMIFFILPHGKRTSSIQAPDGRRILLAWMSRMEEDQEQKFAQDEPRIHCPTLPRELHLYNGRLVQKPVRELYRLLGTEIPLAYDRAGRRYTRELPGRTWQMTLEAADCPSGLQICLEEASLFWDGTALRLTRQTWTGGEETRSCPLDRLDGLEIWSDQSSIEVFPNHGEAVLSARIFPQTAAPLLTIAGAPAHTRCTVRTIAAGPVFRLEPGFREYT